MQAGLLDTISSAEKSDSEYIGTLLTMIFGTDALLKSSISGLSKCPETSQKLDELKLKFVEGNYYY